MSDERIILARARLAGGDAEIVLCKLPRNGVTPWVTWVRDRTTGNCYLGHYFSEHAAAVADFHKRCRRARAIREVTLNDARQLLFAEIGGLYVIPLGICLGLAITVLPLWLGSHLRW